MIARVEGDRIVGVEGDPDDPISRGKLCVIGRNSHHIVDSPDRLLHPMRRSGNEFENVGWDDALDDITKRLAAIKSEYGPGTFAVYNGFTHRSINHAMTLRFANVFGTPNLGGAGSLCVCPMMKGYSYTFGPARYACSDFRNARCILLFGTNPAISAMHRHRNIAGDIEFARKTGAKLIVVDPRRCEAAKNADIYLQIRPGTDLALVLAMLNVVIAEELYDRDFVDTYTTGFSQLAEGVSDYTPRWASEITGLRATDIEQVARLYATSRPASLDRREGAQHHVNAFHTMRAMACLIAITGNVDCEGGLLFNPGYQLADLSLKEKMVDKPLWKKHFPLAMDAVSTFPKEILSGKIKAMLVVGGNPAASWPNSNRVSRALDELELLVVHDIFLTETARHAHYVLPAASFFEKLEIDVNLNEHCRYLLESPPIIEPRGECLPEWKLLCELGRRLGLEGFEFRDAGELADRLLSPHDFPRSRLREASHDEISPGWFIENGFKTPSARIELYCETLAEHGFEPLPVYVEPSESPVSQPELALEYPLVLTTGHRLPWFSNSQMHEIPALAKHAAEPPLEIHAETARGLGISDGDGVLVETVRGKSEAVAKYADISPGVVPAHRRRTVGPAVRHSGVPLPVVQG